MLLPICLICEINKCTFSVFLNTLALRFFTGRCESFLNNFVAFVAWLLTLFIGFSVEEETINCLDLFLDQCAKNQTDVKDVEDLVNRTKRYISQICLPASDFLSSK